MPDGPPAGTSFPEKARTRSWGHQFHHVALQFPDRTALAYPGTPMTYAALDAQTDRIAAAVHRIAPRPHTHVGVETRDPLDSVAGLIGVWKSGHVAIPIDPSWPAPHRESVLRTLRVNVLLAQDDNRRPTTDMVTVPWQQAIDHATEPARNEPGPDDPACLLFSSGSTGEPKGIVLSHRCLMHAAHTYIHHMEAGPDDRIVWTSPVTVGAALLPIMTALLAGGALHRFEIQRDGITRFHAWMEQHRITIWPAVPSLFQAVIESLPASSRLECLRVVKLGGEPVPASHARLFEQRLHPDCTLMNGLGITECGGNVCWYRHPRGGPMDTPTVPIGSAVPGMALSLRDEQGRRATTGELIVRSDCLGLGYWNPATGTIDPFSPPDHDGTTLFPTRDLVAMDARGNLVHTGRVDGMLKIRGHRVERARVEAALVALPWIKEAAVRTHAANGATHLIAHVVWRTNPAPDLADLRAALAASLPDHHIPSLFIPSATLPRLPNGKLDRRGLEAIAPAPSPAPPSGPTDALEHQLLVLWRKALARPDLDVEADFFTHGGDSLAAVRFFAQVEQRLGINLPLSTLAHHRTVRALAAHIRASRDPAACSCAHLLKAGDHRTPLFCVPGAGSDSLALMDLANHLDPHQTVYALQYAGLSHGEAYQNRIPAIAARYLKDIRRIQPTGPYALAGTSFGGWVAYELAQQLTAAGETVAVLALLDTYGPGYLDPHPNPALRRRALLALRWLLPIGRKEDLGAANIAAGIREKLERGLAWILRALRPGQELPRRLRYLHLQDHCFAAGRAYHAAPYDGGPVDLFRAEHQPPAALFRITPDMGWAPLASRGLRIHDIPGHHGAHIRPPHVQELARRLQACLPACIPDAPGRFAGMTERSRERWDELAAWWDAQSGEDGHADTRDLLLPLCLRLLELRPGEHLIDAGCGNGWIARRLARAGVRVTAFDYSAKLLHYARQRDPDPRITYLHLDATHADQLAILGQATADGALCYMALMDIADITPMMEALFRCIRPGGRLVFAMVHPESEGLMQATSSQVLTNIGKPDQPVPHYYFHRPLPLLITLMEQAGWLLDQTSAPGSPNGARFLVGRLLRP